MSSDKKMPNGLFGLVSVLALGLGLWFTVGSVVVMTGIHDKRERLPRDGVTVTADVVRWKYDRRAGGPKVKLSYLFDGREYRPEIKCGCTAEPPATLSLSVDPRKPAEFVSGNYTNDSLSVFNGPANIPVGLLVAAAGGLFTWVAFGLIRRDRRETDKLRRYREAKARG